MADTDVTIFPNTEIPKVTAHAGARFVSMRVGSAAVIFDSALAAELWLEALRKVLADLEMMSKKTL